MIAYSRSLSVLFALLLCLASAHEARAEFWRTQGTKPGPFMFNLKLGGAFGVAAGNYTDTFVGGYNQFALQLEAGFAVTPDRNGYIVVPLQFQFSPTVISVYLPVGFQYDIKMPLKGLYI